MLMRAPRPPRTTITAVVALAFLALLSTGSYTVRPGDTLGSIAAANGTTVGALAAANGLADADRIYVGQELDLTGSGSAGGGQYRVRAGDTLGTIASRHGTTVAALVRANDLRNPNLILIGQRIDVPAGSAGSSGAPTPAGGATTHVVRSGDTIAGVAGRYGISQAQLIAANGLTDGRIYTGQQLRLVGSAGSGGGGGGGGSHEVASGDTLAQIALDHGTTVGALLRANDIDDPDLLVIGQYLTIPSGGGGGLARCPIAGGAHLMNDWGFPRSGGRFHEGNDLFAPRGTPAVAVVAGSVVQRVGRLGGNQVRLVGDDGVSYSYTHLDSFGEAGRVSAGTVIGYVGNSGNAAGGATHVHFEVHPGGGAATNPYPVVAPVC
jgi:LysM repeat protein